MAFTGHENHDILPQDAGAMTRAYRARVSADPTAHLAVFFGKDKLMHMLSQQDCVGLRFYFALDGNGRQTLIAVGADGFENDIIGEVADHGLPCPSRCSVGNVLNT
jgi:hypothetical protein